MDEFLSEKEQIEQIRSWWRENGWYVIGGVVIALLGFFGLNQYRAYQERRAESAAELYESIQEAVAGNDESAATTLLAQLRAEHAATSYADQGGLLVARLLLVSAPDRAADELRYVMEHTDERELGLVARLRLARVLAYREQYAEALALLEVAEPGQFAGRLNEVKGDIYAAQGQGDAARSAYLAAMTSPGSEVLDRNFLQMKLNDLNQASAASESIPAEPAAGAAEPAAAPAEDETEAAEPAGAAAEPTGAAEAPAESGASGQEEGA